MSRKGSASSSNGLPSKEGTGDGEKTRTQAETKAAYVAIIGDIKKDIVSRSDFEKVLQQAGRNPSQKTVEQYWTKDTKKLTLKEVTAIALELKPTSEDDLLKAFRKIDVNGDGYITQGELTKVLTQRGDKMSEKEVEDMIAEADKDGDKKLNYSEFCKLIMSTTSTCQETSLKRLERKERKQKRAEKKTEKTRDSTKDTSRKSKEEVGVVITLPPISQQKASQKEPINIKDWYHTQSRGCFHFDDEQKIVSHQYVLDVDMNTKLWLTVKPVGVGKVKGINANTDINMFVLKQSQDGLVGDVVTFTRVKHKETYCIQGELQPGSYRLIPMTTGCHFRPRTRNIKEKTILIQPKGSEECELTKAFKTALDGIFEMVDLDENGSLSRHEFNLFQLRTSGEAVDDDAWEVVEENFELENGELTKKGFMDLNQMEANEGFQEGGQVDDLWVTLSSMGFADDLLLDEACPFQVDVYTEHSPVSFKSQPLQRGGPTLQKAICQSVINAAGFTKVKSVRDMKLHTYMGDGRVTIVVENKGSKKCGLKLDCSKSQNCLRFPSESTQTVQCFAGASTVAFHLVPADEDKEWTINCQEALVAS